jgi:hypothetical protein
MALPEYRYEFRELLTGRPMGEIQLYGVNFSVKLSDGGNGQGYFRLDGSNLPTSYTEADIRRANAEMLEMTEPGFAEIVIYRNGQPLLGGGGEIISQSHGSQGKATGIYWRTWESSLEMVTLDEFVCPRIWENEDQLNIARELWLLMQFQISSNVRVQVPPEYPLGSSKLISYLEINAWDRKTYRAVMDDLAKQDDGFDWRVVTRMLGDYPTKYLELGYPSIGKTSDAFFFEYGRNMASFYYTRNLGAAGNIIYVTGEGSGQEAPVGSYQDSANLGKNYRRKDYIINDNQLPAELVQPRATMEGLARTPPIAVPSIELDEIEDFGEWWVGDWGVLSWPVGTPRFPNGFETTARITQIEVSPPSDSDAEKIKPTFQSLEGSSGD